MSQMLTPKTEKSLLPYLGDANSTAVGPGARCRSAGSSTSPRSSVEDDGLPVSGDLADLGSTGGARPWRHRSA
jgi:hypothetical protein